VKGRLCAKTQLDSSSRFDITPACDGRTDGHMHDDKNTALAQRRAVKMDKIRYPDKKSELSSSFICPIIQQYAHLHEYSLEEQDSKVR